MARKFRKHALPGDIACCYGPGIKALNCCVGCSSSVIRKISSEARLAMQCDKDLIMSLLILQTELLMESVSSNKSVKGFIQHIHVAPFRCHML